MAITTIPEVREEIQQNINTNNNRAITGQVLQTTLVDMLDTVDDVKANTTGYYEGMSVGLADNLISPDTENDSASWLYRSTAGDKDVSSGFATIEGMKGNTIVWNQLGDNYYNNTILGVTVNKSSGVISAHGELTGIGYVNLSGWIDFPRNNNVYLINFHGNNGYAVGMSGYGGFDKPWILHATEASNWKGTLSIYIPTYTSGDRIDVDGLTVMFINLTKMFGGNNNIVTALGLSSLSDLNMYSVTVGEPFNKLFPSEYYAYDEGSLLSFNPTDIQTTGFNQYDNSKQTANVHVLADQKYRIKGTYGTLKYSDGSDVTVTDGYFTPDRVDRLTLTGGNNLDTCVHLSWSGYRDGVDDYEKYWSVNTDLSWINQITYQGNPLFPNGLCKAGDVYDEISEGKAIKRVGSVDLGTINWNYAANDKVFYINGFNQAKAPLNGIRGNILCSKYETKIFSLNVFDYIYLDHTNFSNQLGIRTESYNDVSVFKTAMSGVMLYYELATPIVVDLPDGINLNYRMDDFGTEEFINTTAASDVPGLCKPTLADIGYQTNLRDKIRRLDENYVSLNLQENSESKKLTARQNIDAASTSGSYPQMTVGNLIADVDTPREFTFEETGGGGTVVGNGYADVKKIEGNTIVWNQLVKNGNFSNGIINWDRFVGCTISVLEGTMTVTSDTSTGEHYCTQEISNIIASHKYYCSITQKTDGTSTSAQPMLFIGGEIRFLWATNDNVFEHLSVIVTAGTGTLNAVRLYTPLGGTTQYKNIHILDLTKMFGAGNEPTTVEEFERLFPMEYAPYCEGRLISLGGYKIKWNQLVDYDSSHYSGWAGASVSKETQGEEVVFTTTGTTPDNTSMVVFSQQISGILDPSHLWYVSGFMKSSITGTVRLQLGNTNVVEQQNVTPDVWYELKALARDFSAPSEAHKSLIIRFNGDTSNVGVVYSLRKPQLFDLTAMFGPGSEPTIEEFEAMFGTQYSPYDEGTEMNILEKVELQDDFSVKSTGFNLWDEEWEVGTIDDSTGEPAASTRNIRTKNFIHVQENTNYFIYTNNTSMSNAFCYDINKNFIGLCVLGTAVNLNYPVTTVAGTVYMKVAFSATYGTTYKNDICINFSDPAKNGTYLPYTTSTQDLSWIYDLEYTPEGSTTPEKLFPYGLLSAGDVHDEITDTGAVKRIGVVDLGDFNYKVMNFSTSGYAWTNEKDPDISVRPSADYSSVGCVCSKYPSALYGSDARMEDKTIAVSKWTNASGAINIKDSSMSGYTTEQVKAALKGVMLYYELETPITVTFTSPKDLGYNVQSGGTEELLPTNPSGSGPITAPVLLSVNYPLDAVGTLTNLPRNYISVASMDSFTTALGNFLNANITRAWDATNEKYTFTVVSRT